MKSKVFMSFIAGLMLFVACGEKDEETMKLNKTNVPLDKAFEYVKSSGGIDEYNCTLNNLSVLLMEDHSAPVVTFMVTYHVGSRNEAIGNTGSTHLLEHMMFKGTTNFNKEKGNDVVPMLQNVGAQINATTWMDRTNYYELLPSEYLGRAVEIEADRMKYLLLMDEDRQPEMTVVRNEFEQGENDPYESLDKNIWATAYQAHPYHHSTIGWRSDIEGVSTERLREFYETFYWPNNATVTIIGDFNKDEALKLVLDNFGKFPSSPEPIPDMYTTEPKQEGPRRVVVKRTGQNGIVGIAHKTPEGIHKDTYPIQILSRVLAGGKSSRLYKKIVDKGLATSISIFDNPFHDNGLFITYAFLTPDTKLEKIENIILDEYEDIKTNGVTDDEVMRAKGQIRAEQAFSRDGSFSIASNLNEAIAIGDWTFYTDFLTNIDAVTPEGVKRIADNYLNEDQSTTGYFVPKDGSGGGGGEPPSTPGPKALMATPEANAIPENGGIGGTLIAEQIVDSMPLEGLRLMTMETSVEDVVTISGSFYGGDAYSPEENFMVADLTAAMLDQGTKNKTKYEISEALESVGARVSFF
ncbi:insulinase family protein [Candidatus Neomarinimicrobiota bacterium]